MSKAAEEYGGALFDLAVEEGVAKEISEEISLITRLLSEEPGYLRVLASPKLKTEEKHGMLEGAFSGFHPHLLHFLCILVDRGYVRGIPACLAEYERRYLSSVGVLPARVVSAVALTEEERERLTDTLSRKFGKTVRLACETDPALIGGARVYIDGKLFDGTARHRLDGLGEVLRQPASR